MIYAIAVGASTAMTTMNNILPNRSQVVASGLLQKSSLKIGRSILSYVIVLGLGHRSVPNIAFNPDGFTAG
jgi:hypothetical protein